MVLLPGARFPDSTPARSLAIVLLRRLPFRGEGAGMKSEYGEVYERSLRDPAGFWAQAAEDIHWGRRCGRGSHDSRPPYSRCIVGGRLNTSYTPPRAHVHPGRTTQ